MAVSPLRRPALPLATTPLVGREAELAGLDRLLTDRETRLTTLTGPPGVGKTRLAVAAAGAAVARFSDGVLFVDLTAVRDPELVPAEVTAALEAVGTDPEQLTADRDLLLVLDNVEHVLAAGPALAGLLATCPGLHLLATSRERLHLRAEREFPVAPLALPGPAEVADPERLAAIPSVAMLVQRVRAFLPEFAVTQANRAALAEICVRLDGLPLALELAAPRLRLFTPGELTFRLRSRMSLLATDARDVPERHRTLRAALSWSHDLLGPDERAPFRRLSVFAGGWTLDAVGAVCAVRDPVATTASLVDKSLVRRTGSPGDVGRFGMLESLREFAAEQLDRAGETEETRARHAEYFAAEATGITARVGTPRERAAVEEVGAEVGNLRQALTWSLAADQPALALRLATALAWYAYTRGRLGDGQATLQRAIDAADAAPGPPDDALAEALLFAGVVAFGRGDLDGAARHLLRSQEVDEGVGSPQRTAIASAFLGHLARTRGCPRDAVAHHQRARALHEQMANAPGIAWSRYDLGLLARREGDTAGAAEHLSASLATFRDLGYRWALGCAAWALATVELRRGRVTEAAALLEEALACAEAGDDRRGLAQCLEAAAAVAAARCAYPTAAALLGSAGALRDRLGAPVPADERDAHSAVVRRVWQVLGPDAARRGERTGRAMSAGTALATARHLLAGEEPVDASATGLTRREHEVATLVRRGRTNRQIGRQLGIAEKTAEVHVHNIIRKLGASSRAEIAAWVAADDRTTTP